MMVALRDALRWVTQGAWVQDLPRGFQWLGLSQAAYPFVAAALVAAVVAALAWGLRDTAAGRRLYATGSNAGRGAAGRAQHVARHVVRRSPSLGALTGLAAVLNAMRFNQIPANAGLGLELKVIAAVVVGGTAITGGRGHARGHASSAWCCSARSGRR